MWGDILLSLTTSVGEAICTNFIEKVEIEKYNMRLNRLIEEQFLEFADTSLDCNDFGRIIKGHIFIEMLRNYFCSIKDRLSNEAYVDHFISCIIKEASACKKAELRYFFKKIEELYIEHLNKIITSNYELNALYNLITVSHRELIGKMSENEEAMQKYIDSLDKKSIDITNNDIISYHRVCNHDFGMIKFIGISGAENKDPQNIDDFYVKNTFSLYSKEIIESYKSSRGKFDIIQLEEFFIYNNKVILIGGAGFGKSTTLNYIFCNYEILFGVNALKIKIDLKEYAKNIADDKRDILWCLSTEFSKRLSKTRLSFNEIELVIAKYLDEGKCLIILDALDEIPTQPIRIKVRDEIANFTEVYYLSKYIITTREAGYFNNKFDESFFHIKINDFDDEQIKKYSSNWYNINYAHLSFESFWERFYQEVERSKCRDIIRNPIVLILALVIFNIEKNLPNRRVEFYKKCIDTFLEVRENRKCAFDMDSNFKNILSDDSIVPKIAYYKFAKLNEDIGYKFTTEELNKAIIEAIEVNDIRNWINTTKQFAQYLIIRTELIKEIDDDNLDFTHKTFYEYFLAVYFSKEYNSDELMQLLVNWIGDANYDELARLIIEVIVAKNDSSQHKYMISYLFDYIKEANEEEKKIGVLSILSQLYGNSMLLPKFHEQYNECLLFNSYLVSKLEKRFVTFKRKYGKIMYNNLELAETFIKLNEKNNNNLYQIIESLYYYDAEYRNEVAKRSNLTINMIALLYSNVQDLVSKKRSRKIDCKNIINYFEGEGFVFLQRYPSLYISYIDIITLNTKKEINEDIFNISFMPKPVFQQFTTPDVLYRLINKSFDSWRDFLLLLICIIQCAKDHTNFLLGYFLENFKNKKVEDEQQNKCIKILRLLNRTQHFEQFAIEIDKLKLYNAEYNELYNKLYMDYQMREKGIRNNRIQRYLEKIE